MNMWMSKQEAIIFHDAKRITKTEDWKTKVTMWLDNGNLWECLAEFGSWEAEIEFKSWMDRETFIQTAIHELLHCVTAEFRDFISWGVYAIISDKRKAKKIEQMGFDIEERIVDHFEQVIYALVKDSIGKK